MPKEDNLQEGYKFPFNACEILCSENSFILDKFINIIRIDIEGNIIEEKKETEPTDAELDDMMDKVSKRLDEIKIKQIDSEVDSLEADNQLINEGTTKANEENYINQQDGPEPLNKENPKIVVYRVYS
jgi:hypothetical protein